MKDQQIKVKIPNNLLESSNRQPPLYKKESGTALNNEKGVHYDPS